MKNIFSALIAVASLTLLTACPGTKAPTAGEAVECIPSSDGIVGGYKVNNNDALAKKVVLLLTRKDAGGVKVCTGTPIAKDVILTAAHCVSGDDVNNMNVVFRTNASCDTGFNLNTDSVKVQSVIVHSGYKVEPKNVQNDIALIKIKSTIPADYEVSELYDGKSDLTDDYVTLIGYGVNSEWNKDSSTILRTTKKDIKDKEISIKNDRIEIKQKYSGICMGDSGGPVFFEVDGKLKIAGVNSFVGGSGTESTICHGIGTSMYVPYFMDWLQTQSANLK